MTDRSGGAHAIEQDTLQDVQLGQYFRITPRGLEVIGHPPLEAFAALGETLRTLDRSLQFAVGDFFRETEDRFGEAASQILDHTGWSEETLRNYRWVAEKVAPDVRRMDRLYYTHHQAVAKLPPAEQKKWLDRAAEPPSDEDGVVKPWGVGRLKSEIKHAAVPLSERTWGVQVFCDSEADQAACCRQLDNLSRRYRTFTGAKKEGAA